MSDLSLLRSIEQIGDEWTLIPFTGDKFTIVCFDRSVLFVPLDQISIAFLQAIPSCVVHVNIVSRSAIRVKVFVL
jgi:hypothetical protein